MSASYQQLGVFTTEKHDRPPNIAEKPSGQVAFKKKKRENQNGTMRVSMASLFIQVSIQASVLDGFAIYSGNN